MDKGHQRNSYPGNKLTSNGKIQAGPGAQSSQLKRESNATKHKGKMHRPGNCKKKKKRRISSGGVNKVKHFNARETVPRRREKEKRKTLGGKGLGEAGEGEGR